MYAGSTDTTCFPASAFYEIVEVPVEIRSYRKRVPLDTDLILVPSRKHAWQEFLMFVTVKPSWCAFGLARAFPLAKPLNYPA